MVVRGLVSLALSAAIAAGGMLCPSATRAGDDYLGFDIGNAVVPASSIVHGGPAKDGIPALTDPSLATVTDFAFFDDDERVIGVAIGDEARAYPIRILNWHEVVNDRLGGRYLVVSWCPLCGSDMVFDGTLGGKRLLLGVSGLLYNSDVLMYDRHTESLWSQLLGKAIAGPLVNRSLNLIPASHTSWADWRKRYPNTDVISFHTGHRRDYGRDPYLDYADSSQLYYAVKHRDARFHPKEVVAGLIDGGTARAWPLTALAKRGEREIIDSFKGETVRIRYDKSHRTVTILDGAGRQLPAVTAYWFAWYAFYPDTSVFPDVPAVSQPAQSSR